MVLTWVPPSPPARRTFFDNHTSSKIKPEFIDAYIEKERSMGRYLGPFSRTELEHLIGPFRTSPLGLVPKSTPGSFRMIQDMSFPRNDPDISSVNAGIDSDAFPTKWGTFDSVSELILSLPPGCVAAAFDISAAYRITPIHPSQQRWFCVSWRERIFLDLAVAFGMASSAGVFGSIADMLVAIYEKAGFGPLRKWVDDFFAIRLPGQSWTEQDFMDLTAALGVPWSIEKLKPFATVQRYIGFDWDLDRKMVSLPTEKLAAILELMQQWILPNATFTASEAAHMHGKLVHIGCIFPLIRPFLRSIAFFAASFNSRKVKWHPRPSVITDIKWIYFIINESPNCRPLSDPTPIDIGWWGDASSSYGIGIIINHWWAVWRWAPGTRVGTGKDSQFDIGWAETVAVELGFRLGLTLGLLQPRENGRNKFLVRSDNLGVVSVLNKGRSRSDHTNTILREIYQLQARNNVRLQSVHVRSEENISDALSRGEITKFLSAFPTARRAPFLSLPAHLGRHLIPSS